MTRTPERLAPLSGEDWREWPRVPIADSTPEVALRRLHLDRSTRATVSLVRFPSSWRRPVQGRFTVTEEFVLLDGALTLGEETFDSGDLVLVPADARRGVSSSEGALALAWFSGVPEWIQGPGGDLGVVRRSRVDRPGPFRVPSQVLGSTRVTSSLPSRRDCDRDLLQVEGSGWAFVPAGAPAPPVTGLVVERCWPGASTSV